MFLPSTTVDVYRDARQPAMDSGAYDVYPHDILDGQDPFEAVAEEKRYGPPAPVLTKVPVSISEDREDRRRPADDPGPTVTTYTIRAASSWGLTGGDRLRDLGTGLWYVVRSARTPPPLVGATSARLEAVRVGVA